jgi:hypothetical protein
MKKILFLSSIILLLLIISPEFSHAQCAMCQRSAETSLAAGNNTAKGLNAGILYMMMVPYVLISVIGYWWYKNYRKSRNAK